MEQTHKKVLMVLNTLAGRGITEEEGESYIKSVRAQCPETEVFQMKPETALAPRESLPGNNDANLIVSCGGDGTFNQVINQYLKPGTLPYFSYVPLGHTNHFALSNGIPADAKDALKTALDGKLCKCDAGKLNDKYFSFVAAFCSASSLHYVTSEQMKSVFDYAIHILRAVGELNMKIGMSFHMKAETDGGSFEGDYIFGSISNLSAIDGKNLSNDMFSNSDGKMELFLIKAPKDRNETVELLNALRNNKVDHPLISISKISKATFVTDSQITCSIDGEYGGICSEVNVEVLKEALTIKIPGKE